MIILPLILKTWIANENLPHHTHSFPSRGLRSCRHSCTCHEHAFTSYEHSPTLYGYSSIPNQHTFTSCKHSSSLSPGGGLSLLLVWTSIQSRSGILGISRGTDGREVFQRQASRHLDRWRARGRWHASQLWLQDRRPKYPLRGYRR